MKVFVTSSVLALYDEQMVCITCMMQGRCKAQLVITTMFVVRGKNKQLLPPPPYRCLPIVPVLVREVPIKQTSRDDTIFLP